MDYFAQFDFTDPKSLISIIKLIAVYFALVWVSLVIWVIKDVTNRTSNIFMHIVGILSVLLFPIFGIFIYLLIRPQKTLFEQYYENEFEHLNTSDEKKVTPTKAIETAQKELKKHGKKTK